MTLKYIEYSADGGWDVRPYNRWLDKHRLSLPEGARYFAEAHWHYDIRDHFCPHDSWLERFEILELGSGGRGANRKNDASLAFLGAFHDLRFTVTYAEIRAVRLEHSSVGGFGDWLIDEIRMDTENKYVIHEIIFSNKTIIEIESLDLNISFKNIT